jgi:hypothetical protein
MNPMGFNRIQPRIFTGQGSLNNPDFWLAVFNLLIMFPNPFLDRLAAMPGSIIPN